MVTGASGEGTKVDPKRQVTGVGRLLWKEVVYQSPDLPSDSHQWWDRFGCSLSIQVVFRVRHTAVGSFIIFSEGGTCGSHLRGYFFNTATFPWFLGAGVEECESVGAVLLLPTAQWFLPPSTRHIALVVCASFWPG
jgi:hypothetical protein